MSGEASSAAAAPLSRLERLRSALEAAVPGQIRQQRQGEIHDGHPQPDRCAAGQASRGGQAQLGAAPTG